MYCSKCSLRNPIQSLIFWNAIFDDIQILCLGFLCSDLHHAYIKDFDFLAGLVLRPRLRKGCRSQNQYINDKHLLIQKALSEWGDLGTSVYNWTIKGRKCRYLSLDLCLLILACLFYKQTHAFIAVLLKRKYCLRFVNGRKCKFYYQLRIPHLNVLLKI